MVKTIYGENRRGLWVHGQSQHEQHIQRTLTGIVAGELRRRFHIAVCKLNNLSWRRDVGIDSTLFRCAYGDIRCPIDHIQDIIHV